MYDNVGGKLKGFAVAIFIVGTIASVVFGIILLETNGPSATILVAILGSIGAWLSSLAVYGFGELIEMVSVLTHRLVWSNQDLEKAQAGQGESLAASEIKKLAEDDLITLEEMNEMLKRVK